MANLTMSQVYALALGAGFNTASATVATAIAQAESGLDPAAVGDVNLEDRTWGPSVGLWQIRSLKAASGTGTPRDATRLKDPAFNAAAAYAVSGGGKDFRPWSTYSRGQYKNYLGAAQTAVANIPASSLSALQVLAGNAAYDPNDASTWTRQQMLEWMQKHPGQPLPGDTWGRLARSAGGAAAGVVATKVWPYALTGIFVLVGAAMVGLGVYRLGGSSGLVRLP